MRRACPVGTWEVLEVACMRLSIQRYGKEPLSFLRTTALDLENLDNVRARPKPLLVRLCSAFAPDLPVKTLSRTIEHQVVIHSCTELLDKGTKAKKSDDAVGPHFISARTSIIRRLSTTSHFESFHRTEQDSSLPLET